MGSAGGNDEPVSEESTCSDEGSLSEPPPSPLRCPRRRARYFKVGRAHVRKPEDVCQRQGRRVGRRNVTRSLSLWKPPVPPIGEIHPPRRAPEGGLLSLRLLGRGGHQLAMRPPACPRPPTGNQGAGGGGGWRGGGALRYWSKAPPGRWGVQTPPGAGYPREGEKASCGSCWEYYASAADDPCAGGSGGSGGGGEDVAAVALLVASGVRQGRGFRVEGEARSDPSWPVLVQCLAEVARVALWLAPRLRVDLLRLLGSCIVMAEQVFAAAED